MGLSGAVGNPAVALDSAKPRNRAFRHPVLTLLGTGLRNPPSASRCSYSIPLPLISEARTVFLAQGARCDVGKCRTSARNSIRFVVRSGRNSSNERVEWPMVQMVTPSRADRLEDIASVSRRSVITSGARSRTLRRRLGPDDCLAHERIRDGRTERLSGAEVCAFLIKEVYPHGLTIGPARVADLRVHPVHSWIGRGLLNFMTYVVF